MSNSIAPDGADRSFQARFGATILRGGIAAIPIAIFTYQKELDLTPQEIWFIAYILARKWSASLPHPSLRKMAERTGYTEQQLHRIKNSLMDKGYLHLVERYQVNGGQASNAYDFGDLFGRLEALLIRDGVAGEEQEADDDTDTPAPAKVRKVVKAAQAGGVPPTNIYVSGPSNNPKPPATPTNIFVSDPPNTSVTPPLTEMLVAPLTPVLDEEEADQAEPKQVEPPPPTPSRHIPGGKPVVVVEGTYPDWVEDDARFIVQAHLATAGEARRLAQVAYGLGKPGGYVEQQIQHVLNDPEIKKPERALRANIEAGREFLADPPRRQAPRNITLLPTERRQDVATPPLADPGRPDPMADTRNEIWRRALGYLAASCSPQEQQTLKYVQLRDLDAAAGTALLVVPNENLRRQVAEHLATPISLALRHAGQPSMRLITIAAPAAGIATPTLADLAAEADRPHQKGAGHECHPPA